MDNKGDKKIKVTKNGPYLVTGNIPLAKEESVVDKEGIPASWHKISDFPDQKNYRLCRCGHSRQEPFCDESHIRSEFDGTETAVRNKFVDRAKVTEGPDLNLDDDASLCSQARFCHRAGGIWNLTVYSDNRQAKKTAIEEAGNCPSGRLVAREKDSSQDIEPRFTPAISVTEDLGASVPGPLWVKGGIPVEAADGKIYEVRNRLTLCRCGRSQNKPFCDGSHLPAGFKD